MSHPDFMDSKEQKKETIKINVEIPVELQPEFKKRAAEEKMNEKDFGGKLIIENMNK